MKDDEKEHKLTHAEKAVVRALYALHRPANINEIGTKANMNWHTTFTTLKKLSKKDIVLYRRYADQAEEGWKGAFWELNYSILEDK